MLRSSGFPAPTTSDIRRSNFNALTSRLPPHSRLLPRTRSSPLHRRLLPRARPEIRPHRPTLASCSGPASFARFPAQEPHRPVRIEFITPRQIPPVHPHRQTLSGLRLQRSLPERDCRAFLQPSRPAPPASARRSRTLLQSSFAPSLSGSAFSGWPSGYSPSNAKLKRRVRKRSSALSLHTAFTGAAAHRTAGDSNA